MGGGGRLNVPDRYERTTQLKPAVWALAPLTLLVVLLVRVQSLGDLTRSALLLVAAAGVHLIVMRLVRDRGGDVQKTLWKGWGGSPTVQRLRWADNKKGEVIRLHRRVQAMTGVELPKTKDEARDPEAADDVYDDAVARLRELTRSQDAYPRVYSELILYGAARNLYGLKPLGIVLAALVFLTSAVGVGLSVVGLTGWAWWPLVISGCWAAIVTSVWLLIITPSYVRRAADRYADALLSTPHEPGIGSAR